MTIKPNQLVTVVCNNTGKEFIGFIEKYAPDEIIVKQVKFTEFNAKEVHFKKEGSI